MTIYINHIGFTPGSSKSCLMGGGVPIAFRIREKSSGSIVFEDQMKRIDGDFGAYLYGDLTDLREPGMYIVEAGRERSQPFQIKPNIYDEALKQMLTYFTLQRCGDSDCGWNGPCHLDDGRRADNGKHQDVEGGWHDACDLRKWVSATIFGMLGLSRLKDVLNPDWDEGQIIDELRWGNRYFLKMQEPIGYVMNHCGGDLFTHADNNRWTDNDLNSADDRMIDTSPCDTTAQWIFVLVEAALSRLTHETDPLYAERCINAAEHCFTWLKANDMTHTTTELGVAISALVEYHRCTENTSAIDLAIEYADTLLSAQVRRQEDSRSPVWGFFLMEPPGQKSPMSIEPYRAIIHAGLPLTGLCDLVSYIPEHCNADSWRMGIRLHCENYLKPMAARNEFNIVPYGLYRTAAGGNRRVGAFWYRWFMEPKPSWHVGINANVASLGVGLTRAAKLLGDSELLTLAQRQLDWIAGVNPFNASTIMGVGYNNPQHMFGGEFFPPTPFLPGAVMNGIGGDEQDRPYLQPGSYSECEYWTPMVAYTMWLMAELQASDE